VNVVDCQSTNAKQTAYSPTRNAQPGERSGVAGREDRSSFFHSKAGKSEHVLQYLETGIFWPTNGKGATLSDRSLSTRLGERLFGFELDRLGRFGAFLRFHAITERTKVPSLNGHGEFRFALHNDASWTIESPRL
jgi:hypothetical protein